MWLSLLIACGKTPPDAVEPPARPPAEAETPDTPEIPEAPETSTMSSSVVRVADVEWTPLVEGAEDGPAVALLSGDLDAGPFRALLRWPGGYSADLHRHTAGYTGVVLQGIAAHGARSGHLQRVEAGGYWIQPAGEPHGNACVSEAACILYVAFDGPLDRAPARGPGRVDTSTLVVAADVSWSLMDEGIPEGPELAVLAGDLSGESRVMMRFPPGFHSGLHTHTSDYTAAVVTGTHGHGPTEQGLTALQPGSAILQAGGEAHADACSGGDPCILVLDLHGAFDFVPMQSDEAPADDGADAPHKGPPG